MAQIWDKSMFSQNAPTQNMKIRSCLMTCDSMIHCPALLTGSDELTYDIYETFKKF